MYFNKDFLWGASTSAFQVEGAYLEDGKSLSVADIRLELVGKKLNIADSKVSVDFYHRYEEDIELMKELGLKSFRMSISWCRIIPDGEGKVNELGIEFYRKVLMKLKECGIKSIVTLYHFDLPQALIDKYKGFVSRKCIDAFVNYANVCFNYFGNLVDYWLTINEQMVITGIPFFQGLETKEEAWIAFHHMNLAHALVTKLKRSLNIPGLIGPCISYTTTLPASCDSKDMMLAYSQDDEHVFALCDVHIYGEYPKYFINHIEEEGYSLPILEGDDEILKGAKPDFLALNWYVTEVIGKYIGENMHGEYQGIDLPRQNRAKEGKYQYYKNPYTPYSEYNWNKDGVGLRYALRKMYAMYRLPLMITENGWSANETLDHGCIHDTKRIEYMKDMIENMSLAIHDGVELFSYNPWSFIDLLSASQGMDKRYGLVYVDRTNDDIKELKRYKKDSFYFYQDVIKNNGISE